MKETAGSDNAAEGSGVPIFCSTVPPASGGYIRPHRSYATEPLKQAFLLHSEEERFALDDIDGEPSIASEYRRP